MINAGKHNIVVQVPKRNKRRKNKAKPAVIVVEETANATAAPSGKARRRRRRRERHRHLARVGRGTVGGMSSPRSDGLGGIINQHMSAVDIGGASTVAGSMWLAKVLDPCHPSMGVYGIPDLDTSTVVTPQYMGTSSITNAVVDLFHVAGSPVWDPEAPWSFVQIVDWSVGKTCILKYQGDLGLTSSTYVTRSGNGDWIPNMRNVFDTTNGVDKVRLMYAGVTYDPSMATLSDEGGMVCAQTKSKYVKVATQVGGANTTVRDTRYWNMLTTSNGSMTVLKLAQFLDSLTTLDERAASHQAKLGAYVPARWDGGQFNYVEIDQAPEVNEVLDAMQTDQEVKLMPLTGRTFSFTDVPLAVPENIGPHHSENTPISTVMPWETTIMWVRGLAPTSTYQATYRFGVEAQIDPSARLNGTSPWAPFTHSAPMHDQMALEAAVNIRTNLLSAYPASYNFLDKLWGVVKKVAGSVLPSVVKGIPFVGPAIGNLMETMLPGRGGLRTEVIEQQQEAVGAGSDGLKAILALLGRL